MFYKVRIVSSYLYYPTAFQLVHLEDMALAVTTSAAVTMALHVTL